MRALSNSFYLAPAAALIFQIRLLSSSEINRLPSRANP